MLTLVIGADGEDIMECLSKRSKYLNNSNWNNVGIIEACKEIIFQIEDGKPFFNFVMYVIDSELGEIVITPMFQTMHKENESEKDIEDSLKSVLAIATANGIPVFPNTCELEPILKKYQRDIFFEGFYAPDGIGGKTRLKLIKSPGTIVDNIEYLKEFEVWKASTPAEIAILKELALKELGKYQYIEKMLYSLEEAINSLTELLNIPKRSENKIQECIENHPILFGTDYLKFIPKQKLGSEYEMDFALLRCDGIYDLVELESANLPIFNKKGDPSKYLIHAEQQVLDWFEWLEANNPYARKKLPNISSPKAYIVIGRNDILDEKQLEKLRRRNILFNSKINIITYDDLLVKAKNLLKIINGSYK